MSQFTYEVWSVPGIAVFEKKIAALRPLSASGTLYRRQTGRGSLQLPARYERLAEIIEVDPANHANDVASLIRVYRGSDLIQELLVGESPNLVADQPADLSCEGIEAVMDWAVVEAWDWDGTADFESRVPDWIYGGRNLIPSLSLGDLGSIREEWELFNDQTPGGTFTLSVEEPAGNVQTTNSLDFDASASQIEGSPLGAQPGLEGLSNVNDVTVSGDGTAADSPWTIVFFDPPDIVNMTVTDSGGLTSTLTKTVEGDIDPSPVTVSQSIDASRNPTIHGCYDEPPIQVVSTPLDTGADWSLLVNATCRYAGSQIVINGVQPGQLYQASIRIRPTVTGDYTLVIRDEFENLIKNPSPRDNTLTAGSFQTINVNDIEIPEGVTRVIMRAAVTDANPANIADFYVNWQGAEFREGQQATTAGNIILDLLADAQTDHSGGAFPRTTIDFINAGFDGSIDAAGNAWADSELSVNIPRGMTYRKVLDRIFGGIGYEWNLTPTVGTPGEWDLNVWNPDGRGTDHSAADTPSLLLGQGTLGGSATKRIPRANRIISEGGGQYFTRAANTASSGTVGTREWYQADVSYTGAQAEEWTDTTLTRFLDVSLQPRFEIADPPSTEWPIPIVDYGLADLLNVDLSDGTGKVSRAVEAISWRTVDDGIAWGVHTGEAQFDAFPTGALAGSGLVGGNPGGTVRGGAAVAPQRAALALSGPVNEGVRLLLDEFERQPRPQRPSLFTPGGAGGEITIVVAASDAKEISQEKADYVCGGADDQETINEAIDRINAGSPFTGRLRLTEGRFRLSGVLETFEGMIQGTGNFSTALLATGLAAHDVIIPLSGSGSSVRDLSIQGEGIGVQTGPLYDRIDNVYFGTTGNAAIDVRGSSVVISRCIFDDAGDPGTAIWCPNNVSFLSVIDNYFQSAGELVLCDAGLFESVIRGNICEYSGSETSSGKALVDVSSGSARAVIVSGNEFTGGQFGAVLLGDVAGLLSVDCAITGNSIHSSGEGVVLSNIEDSVVAGNLIETRRAAVVLDDADDCLVGNNRIGTGTHDTTNTYDIIDVTGDRNYIGGNLLTPSVAANLTRYGVNIIGGDCNVVVGNRLGDPADYGTDAINDAGTNTQWKYPDDPVYGDNFTVCEPSPS